MNDRSFSAEITSGRRFPFGTNWTRFLDTLSDARIEQAERATVEMLGMSQLHDKTFLDIGSGSGSSLSSHTDLVRRFTRSNTIPSLVAYTRQLGAL